MVPSQLSAAQFAGYPAQARQAAVDHVGLLRQLPLAFVPLLLREILVYDWKFPAERRELDHQLTYLQTLSSAELARQLTPFSKLTLSPDLERFDWVNDPGAFSEQLTAHLWATHQIDAFRAAAVEYVSRLSADGKPEGVPLRRLVMVIVGQGVRDNSYPLFRKMRPEGTYFSNVKPDGGNRILLDAVAARAVSHPVPFGHWYVDGGSGIAAPSPAVTAVSYASLDSVRTKLFGRIESAMRSGQGSEVLRSTLARIRPDELGFSGAGDEAVLDKFKMSLLTEGSGTQLFSTTFVQWTAREALRRAQPLTLLARFAPRRHEQSMSEVLGAKHERVTDDPEGSLVDGDMGAYYTRINQQRLAGAEDSAFLVWFEGHAEAVAIAPSLARGATNREATDLSQLLARLA